MNYPQLKNESDETQDLPFPANPRRELVRIESEARTLYGTLKTDMLYQKWRYVFEFPDMEDSTYNTIKSFIDDATTLYLTWTDRYSDLNSREVHVNIGNVDDFIGAGQLITTQIICEEINKRL